MTKETAEWLLGLIGMLQVNPCQPDSDEVWRKATTARDELKGIIDAN